ncbi:hypothetical protein [Prosthecomicrobium sp. N25]
MKPRLLLYAGVSCIIAALVGLNALSAAGSSASPAEGYALAWDAGR